MFMWCQLIGHFSDCIVCICFGCSSVCMCSMWCRLPFLITEHEYFWSVCARMAKSVLINRLREDMVLFIPRRRQQMLRVILVLDLSQFVSWVWHQNPNEIFEASLEKSDLFPSCNMTHTRWCDHVDRKNAVSKSVHTICNLVQMWLHHQYKSSATFYGAAEYHKEYGKHACISSSQHTVCVSFFCCFAMPSSSSLAKIWLGISHA